MNIGIVGNVRGSDTTYDVFGVSVSYMHFFSRWGTPVVVSPTSVADVERLLRFVDVFVIPGGADVDPRRYNRKPEFYTGKQDAHYEYFDKVILPLLLERGVPIIGICRGFQSLAVAAGLTLNQHLMYHPRSSWDDLVHDITAPGQTKSKSLGKVNSLHHQGVIVRPTWPTNFTPLAVDGAVLEAFRWNNTLGFQWHPEAIADQFSTTKIDEFLSEIPEVDTNG